MITIVYQLISPNTLAVDFQEIEWQNRVLIRPTYMSICAADQRYFQGRRPQNILQKKLPMALIHEAIGEVVQDATGTFATGTPVAMIPNVPGPQKQDIYENYADGFTFLSSGADGFMREIVDLPPDQVVALPSGGSTLALTEMCSVACHAVNRFDSLAHNYRDKVGIWGDGSLGYIMAAVLKAIYPQMHVTVVGRHPQKLDYFSFVDATYVVEELPNLTLFDHVFECTGGDGCEPAVAQIIDTIRPQGTVVLMGVTENPVGILTRMVLEKGLTLVGASRSNRADFERAAKLWENPGFVRQLSPIVYNAGEVKNIDDMLEAFSTDLSTPFKTIFKWGV